MRLPERASRPPRSASRTPPLKPILSAKRTLAERSDAPCGLARTVPAGGRGRSPSAKGNIMSKFGSLGATLKPFRVLIKLDGKQIIDKEGKPFFIDVHPQDGAVGRRFDKEQRDEGLALTKEGKDQPTQME